MASRDQLRQAAAEVIQYMKSIDEISDARVAIIGGLALWMHLKEGRATQDVDFIINIDTAPSSVKEKLLRLPNSPFVQNAMFFHYVKSGQLIQIDITPGRQSPYMPPNATQLKDIPHGAVPFISAVDLIVFKMYSCGLRAQPAKKQIDADDAEALLAAKTQHSALSLTTQQRTVVERGLPDVVQVSSQEENWWRRKLGLPEK